MLPRINRLLYLYPVYCTKWEFNKGNTLWGLLPWVKLLWVEFCWVLWSWVKTLHVKVIKINNDSYSCGYVPKGNVAQYNITQHSSKFNQHMFNKENLLSESIHRVISFVLNSLRTILLNARNLFFFKWYYFRYFLQNLTIPKHAQ